jgi:hypothetical protein
MIKTLKKINICSDSKKSNFMHNEIQLHRKSINKKNTGSKTDKVRLDLVK